MFSVPTTGLRPDMHNNHSSYGSVLRMFYMYTYFIINKLIHILMLLSVNPLSVKRSIQMFSCKTVKSHLKQLIKKVKLVVLQGCFLLGLLCSLGSAINMAFLACPSPRGNLQRQTVGVIQASVSIETVFRTASFVSPPWGVHFWPWISSVAARCWSPLRSLYPAGFRS